MNSSPLFFEKQRFPLRRIGMVLAPPCVMTCLLMWQVVWGHPWGKQPMSNGNVIGWTIFLWLIYFRLITVQLVVAVNNGELRVALSGLWRARTIPLAGIQSVDMITFDPERDYGGYGIRSNRKGTVYIAGGKRGVRLKLKSGATLVLGSQRPEELARALST
jgi:hypothetical protein